MAHARQSLRALDCWWLDTKLGLRMLFKYPGLALAGGFGIAVTVAISTGGFSVIYGAFMVTSLPFEQGDRIVSIEVWDSAASKPQQRILHDFHTWRSELKSVKELSAFRTSTPNLIAPGAQPGSVRVASMSASGFIVPRIRPLLGRYLVEEDEREGAPHVVVIGENVWRNRFGGDRGIVGRTIQLGSTPHSIAGVMPEGFAFPVNHQFWAPLRAGGTPPQPLTGPDLMVFGRLAQGATIESAQAELATIGQRSAQAFPKIYGQLHPRVMPYAFPFTGLHEAQDVGGLHIMQGLATTLLVLVCLNVAILVYSRTATRQGEISVRTALGASRRRIVAQLFIEAFVLSALASVAGVAIAALALRLIGGAMVQFASELPFWISFQLSTESILCAAGLSIAASAIVGVLPALMATRREVQASLKVLGAGSAGLRLGKTWTVLIVAQVGFAVALLPGAIYAAWETLRSGTANPGFAATEFLSAQLGMDSELGGARFNDRQVELMRRLQAEPRVSGLTYSMANPGDESMTQIEIQDGPAVQSEASELEVGVNRVDVNFFRIFEVPILAGREFESADADSFGASVLVNRSFAERIFSGAALGRRFRYVSRVKGSTAQEAEPGRWYEIAGIVSDFPVGASPGIDDSPSKFYHAIAPGQLQAVTLALRLRGGDPTAFAGRLREIATEVDPELQLRNILSLDEVLRREQWVRRLEATVFALLTLTVLLLSSAGIYAMMSITVSQRRKEIGIRIALGADRKRIVASIFSRVFGQLAAGATLGMAVAAAAESGMGFLEGNARTVLPLVALLMIAIGVLAGIGPARRSLRIEPTEALREQ